MNYVLDACALLTFLNDEDGADKMENLLDKSRAGDVQLFMSIINLLEVYYGELREKGPIIAKIVLDTIQDYFIQIENRISDNTFHEAARLKASYKISLADAIGLATAKELSAQFVTSDHAEIEAIEQHELLSILWLPAKPKKN